MLILWTLKPQRLHGYALAQGIQRASNNLLRVQGGTLYQALQRLRKAKLVSAEWDVSLTNRRVRVYKLTVAGAKRLDREVARFEKMLEGITRVIRAAQTETDSYGDSGDFSSSERASADSKGK